MIAAGRLEEQAVRSGRHRAPKPRALTGARSRALKDAMHDLRQLRSLAAMTLDRT
jgi:hypothetical protein